MFKKEVIREEGEPVLFKLNTILQIPLIQIPEDKTKINITYLLIDPFVSVRIYWDENLKEVIYKIQEPELDENERTVLNLIEEGIKELINISLVNIKDQNVVIEYLEKSARILLTELRIRISVDSFIKIMYYIYRDFIGLNDLEPLMRDPFIEDIECNGIGTPIYIVHRKLRNLKTNLTFTSIPYLANLVEKIAQRCGKYVSYANPLLDGSLPDGSRANATYTQDISTKGPTITIRKFTKDPWTPTKLMKNKTVSPEMLAYLWLLLENESNIMVIGGTGSGKTSLLNSIAFFIPPPARIVSIEDTHELQLMHENWLPSVSREATSGFGGAARQGEVSLFDLLKESFRQRPDYVIVGEIRGSIRGNEEVVIVDNNITKRIPIKDLEGKDLTNIYVPTLDMDLKVSLKRLNYFIKHPPRNKLVEIITRTGRRVTVTEDHSLFTVKDLKVGPIETKNLRVGSRIIIPEVMPFGFNDINSILLTDYIKDLRVAEVQPLVKKAISLIGQDKANKLCNCLARQYCRIKTESNIPFSLFEKLMKEARIPYNTKELRVKSGNGRILNNNFQLNEGFWRLIGYYLSEGHLRTGSLVISNNDKRVIEDVTKLSIELFGIKPKYRKTYGWGVCTQIIIHNSIVARLLISLGCGKTESKRIPSIVYGLSRNKICALLKGLYSGDGSFYNNEVDFVSKLDKLAEDVLYLLSCLGIVGRICFQKNKYRVRFKRIEDATKFLKYVGFVQKFPKILQKGVTHTVGNSVNFSINDLKSLRLPRKFRHLRRYMQCSKYYLKKIIDELDIQDENVKKFVNGEFYIDEVKEIKQIYLTKPEPVYDLSISPTENFIGGFGGIILHNSEAYVLFQGMASGHSCMGTMHAEDVVTMIRRLETQPINLSPTLVDSLDAVCVMSQVKIKDEPARKLTAIVEILSVSEEKGKAATNTAFVWNPANDKFMFKTDLKVFDKIIQQKGITKDQLIKEFQTRVKLLIEMYKRNILEIADVHGIINEYYKNPQGVLKRLNIT